MGRELPVLIQTKTSELDQRTLWLVDVHLKADGDYEAEDFYFSTQAVEANDEFYEPLLRDKPRISYSLGNATDGGQIKIDNVSLEFGQKVLARNRFIKGSKIAVWFAWKLPDGSVLTDKVFDGLILETPVSTSDNQVSLRVVGDVYNPDVVLGAFPLAQRCVLDFNEFGLLSPDVSQCGWQMLQGGDPAFCGKTEDDCRAHNNLHRIGAIPFFANVQIQQTTGGGSGTGFPEDPPSTCFVNQSPILLPDFTEKPICEFKAGDAVMSFNPVTGELETDVVEQVHIHTVKRILALKFLDGTIIRTTPEHPFYVEIGSFRLAGELIANKDFVQQIFRRALSCTGEPEHFWSASLLLNKSEIESTEEVEVRNLSVRKNKTFIVARRGVHNLKPIYPLLQM